MVAALMSRRTFVKVSALSTEPSRLTILLVTVTSKDSFLRFCTVLKSLSARMILKIACLICSSVTGAQVDCRGVTGGSGLRGTPRPANDPATRNNGNETNSVNFCAIAFLDMFVLLVRQQTVRGIAAEGINRGGVQLPSK